MEHRTFRIAMAARIKLSRSMWDPGHPCPPDPHVGESGVEKKVWGIVRHGEPGRTCRLAHKAMIDTDIPVPTTASRFDLPNGTSGRLVFVAHGGRRLLTSKRCGFLILLEEVLAACELRCDNLSIIHQLCTYHATSAVKSGFADLSRCERRKIQRCVTPDSEPGDQRWMDHDESKGDSHTVL
ncbi:hypothetical protein PGT21_007393 [Puccinia graminis f. sp. tritici]|uniref:Uncharacterized protein n=1 Tax=Puccinia graminis f. sp. tritici TaxID=56615 RepID=A0A5B0LI81_PUCGR|nr:hypothetical protein PGT21_007393 [Puccinia graminis f. sp. tritici]